MPFPSEWSEAAPLVIAHRGASSLAPENTLPAFLLAADLGADAVELDAKLSRDGGVVAFHDQTLQRTTGRSGRPMDLTVGELSRLDAGAWVGGRYAGTAVPDLDQVLEAVGRRLLVNIELTDYTRSQQALVEAVVARVRRHGLTRRVLLSSFDSAALRAVRQTAPDIPVAHLRGPTWLSVRDRMRRRVNAPLAIHPHVSLVRPGILRAAGRSGHRVHVYTVDDPIVLERLWAMGVDGVITNAPQIALRTRRPR